MTRFVKSLFIILSLLLTIHAVVAQDSQTANDYIPITANSELMMAFAFPNSCGPQSPDGTSVIVQNQGIYDLRTGERLFALSGFATFSYDGSLLAIANDGVYEVGTWTRRFRISGAIAFFSPDGTALIASDDAVYDVATGQRRFSIGDTRLIDFSPDANLIAVENEWIYDIVTGERIFRLSSFATFNRHRNMIAVANEGVYDLTSYELLFPISGFAFFSPDGKYLSVRGEGIYEVDSWTRLFPIADAGSFSPDSTMIFVTGDGLYDMYSGELSFTVSPDSTWHSFNSDMTLLAVGGDALFEIATGDRLIDLPAYEGFWTVPAFASNDSLLGVNSAGMCIFYGDVDNEYPFRSGLIYAEQEVTLYDSPSGDSLSASTRGQRIVFSRTSDNEWFQIQVGENVMAWIPAAEVEILSMPEDVPIENP